MSYAPKHARPTSLVDAVLGHHEPSDTSVLPAGRHTSHEHGDASEARTGLGALTVPRPRQAPDAEQNANPAA
jgi:hypothetical protein